MTTKIDPIKQEEQNKKDIDIIKQAVAYSTTEALMEYIEKVKKDKAKRLQQEANEVYFI